ncbi:DUF4344 domain-containing metallopeptidase [Streptomyces candidus]|uniref:Uncharacterized protein n=1 Tax=Streptomyces candidus TaxID=67283 RepID=A0A7X0HMB4_9ACTN|nr:DUF4344 domain-containing metallopeptidase [Streptomyces candidus]MBB6438997.1 hypothetical protein [Streptomyces candidus]GHH44554.1 hypothetical protein GCM10018773_32350 [Streptomyces candidus]
MNAGEQEKYGKPEIYGIREVMRAVLATAALTTAVLGVSACQQPERPSPPTKSQTPAPTAAPSRSGVRVLDVRYEEPSPADRRDAAFLRGRKTVEGAAADLAEFLGWGGREPLALVVKSCGGQGSSYDPEARRIDICYEEVTETRALLREGGRRGATDDAVHAVQLETLLHESAHALIDVLGLNLPGNEEDAADQFAALMLLRGGAPGAHQLRAAADAWRTSAAMYEDAPGDEHATDGQRADAHLCYAYGAAAGRDRGRADTRSLPAARAAGCAEEWDTVRERWTSALRTAGALT